MRDRWGGDEQGLTGQQGGETKGPPSRADLSKRRDRPSDGSLSYTHSVAPSLAAGSRWGARAPPSTGGASMKIELPIDTSAVSFIGVMSPELVLDDKTKQQRTEANGDALYPIALCC